MKQQQSTIVYFMPLVPRAKWGLILLQYLLFYFLLCFKFVIALMPRGGKDSKKPPPRKNAVCSQSQPNSQTNDYSDISKESCPFCKKIVHDDDRAVQCANCSVWLHLKCRGLPTSDEFCAAVQADCVKILCDDCLSCNSNDSVPPFAPSSTIDEKVSVLATQVDKLTQQLASMFPVPNQNTNAFTAPYSSATKRNIPISTAKVVTIKDMHEIGEDIKHRQAVVIVGLPEHTADADFANASKIIHCLDPAAGIKTVFRMGRMCDEPRPLKVAFNSSSVASSVLRERNKLRAHAEYKGIYIRASMCLEDRILIGKLREKLKQLNAARLPASREKFVLKDNKILHYIDCEENQDNDGNVYLGKGTRDINFTYNLDNIETRHKRNRTTARNK